MASAALSAEQILVVYNSESEGAEAIVAAYLRAHPDLPLQNTLDLSDAVIAGRADISYEEFIVHLRDPIRGYLLGEGGPSAEAVLCVLLIRGLPHRVLDEAEGDVGDWPGEAATLFSSHGNATYASVDSELTLLWQDLSMGERGGGMDSYADNAVPNPYHTASAGFDSFPRDAALLPKKLLPTLNVIWSIAGEGPERLTPGDMLLVARLDGDTVDDVLGAIERAQNLVINQARVVVVLDENDVTLPEDGNRELDDDVLIEGPDRVLIDTGDDYEQTAAMLAETHWRSIYDGTAEFISGDVVPLPVIAYASYGENHGTDGSEYPEADGRYIRGFALARGAIFNTIESFNGRAFNGLGTRFHQGQVAAFIAAGGTFGIGHVYEPFSFAVPDNEVLLDNFLNSDLTWAEAAWSSIPVLSWQHVVVGDPLARVETVVNYAADLDDDGDVDLADFSAFTRCFGLAGLAQADPCRSSDVDEDGDVDLSDFALFEREYGAAVR